MALATGLPRDAVSIVPSWALPCLREEAKSKVEAHRAVAGSALGAAVDQVVRLRAYIARHPGVDVAPPDPFMTGNWKATRNGQIIAEDHELRQLLNTLELEERAT